MNKIYAVALNLHDHNTYDGVYHNQRERHTRFKHNLPYKAEAYAHQSVSYTHLTLPTTHDV